jgi:hypothetical protein
MTRLPWGESTLVQGAFALACKGRTVNATQPDQARRPQNYFFALRLTPEKVDSNFSGGLRITINFCLARSHCLD